VVNEEILVCSLKKNAKTISRLMWFTSALDELMTIDDGLD
jgi:hypothetical protein